MNEPDLSKTQYKEVQELINHRFEDIEKLLNDLNSNGDTRYDKIDKRLRRVETNLLTLQVKSGIMAMVFGGIGSFLTGLGLMFKSGN